MADRRCRGRGSRSCCVTVWWTLGFNAVIYLAALQDIPAELYEAARGRRRGRRGSGSGNVTLPGLRPVLLFVTSVTLIASVNMFGQSFLMTQGGPGTETRTAIYQIADTGLTNFSSGAATAMSMIFTVSLADRQRRGVPAFRERGSPPDARGWRHEPRSRRTLLVRAPGRLLTLLFVSPLVYMLVTSFKTTADAGSAVPQWIPPPRRSAAYEEILGNPTTPVLRWFAEQPARRVGCRRCSWWPRRRWRRTRWRGWTSGSSGWSSRSIITTLFVPPVILLMPNYLIVGRLGWLDTLLAIVVPGAAGAFGVFFLRQFFLSLPPRAGGGGATSTAPTGGRCSGRWCSRCRGRRW